MAVTLGRRGFAAAYDRGLLLRKALCDLSSKPKPAGEIAKRHAELARLESGPLDAAFQSLVDSRD